MERIFQITAVILIGIAVFFWQRGNNDGLFIAAVFGAVSFFLSIRFQVKERLKQREVERDEEEQRKISDSRFQISGRESFLTAEDEMTSGANQRNIDKQI